MDVNGTATEIMFAQNLANHVEVLHVIRLEPKRDLGYIRLKGCSTDMEISL